MRCAMSLFLVGIFLLSVLSAGCINSTGTISTTTSGVASTTSLHSNLTVTSHREAVLTLVGPNGSKKALTFDDLKAFPAVEGKGGLKTKKGTIKDVGTYRGVALETLLRHFNWLSKNYVYRITAADGYSITIDCNFVTGKGVEVFDRNGNPVNGSVIPVLAYEFNGKPIEFKLNGKVYPLRLVFIGNRTLITPGNRWVKAVVRIEVFKRSSTPVETNAGGYIKVTDMAGKTVRVRKPVRRIVSIYGIATQVIYLFGVNEGEKVLGSTPLAINDRFIQLVDPNAERRMVFVGSPRSANIETMEKLKPDVVFTAYWGDPRLNQQMESIGIPVIVLNMESVRNFTKSVEIIGNVLEKKKKAGKIVEYYENAVSFVTSRTDKISESKRPRVLLLEYSFKDKVLKAPGNEFFQNRLITMAGGVSVSANLPGGWNVVDVEQVAKWNPDIIVLVSYSLKKPATEVKEGLLNDPAWSSIRAVKDRKVYAMPNDGESWDFGPKWVLGLYWLAKVIHPELFEDLNITEKASQLYNEFYGIDPEKVKIVGDMP